MNQQNKLAGRIDYGIVLSMMLLMIISLVSIYSAQLTNNQYDANFVVKQAMWFVVSTFAIIVVMQLDYDRLMKWAYYFYGLGLFMLAFVLLFGKEVKGAKSWIVIPFLGNIQPSEVVKVILIIVLAKVIWDHNRAYKVHRFSYDMWLLVKMGLFTLFPLILIMLQPDLGTALVFIAIMSGMILISGITWKIIVPLFGSIAVIGTTLIWMVINHQSWLTSLGFKPYQFERITTWINPENDPQGGGYQVLRALTAIGSGQISGNGVGYDAIAIPENHNDFIFTIVAGDYGFIGASILLAIYFLLIYQIIRVALDIGIPFYSYICTGVVMMLMFHVLENVGMNIGLLPITGIPLPFISYGGSALLGNMMAVGLVLGIRFNYKKSMFEVKEENHVS
ncbi:rod shape-determining protein RodA [Listeria ivanovii]|uniref:Putative cell division protein RodA, FtsW n=1 Tax=Listeria ivanovii (strain ATCC BAA-678 / PAM 55) TaxID=881621 RepID=G2ZF34_LISIP|nr:rod shape-determining protein RodA [Listeria ivanovii]AHI56856.1 cell division protein FtsW [Listeria ivanovii WSLC3009]AIS66274.1 cell cycle protein [Listeria ivanovii subsp. ivanovii]MBC1759931.1 rod shape-determining protein RodA [Listeria ivanovii]MBK3915180.1 rod shape-determining protein RodA [Listeria ivanovii subsp. ivanovii]MBK3922196.1 rod shape-determining protein RodA [Listeria ivanovii subsp. ivanovii]